LKNSEQVTVNMPKDMYAHLEQKVIRKIRLGEGDKPRASMAEEIRLLISADMQQVETRR
jgi:hypothetical protein